MEIPGSTFTLRNWRAEDAASLQKYADNKKISEWLFDRFPSPYTLQNAVEFIQLKAYQNPVTNFPIVINGAVAGVIGLDMREDVYRKTPLLGYWLAEDYWGHGIMTEAVRLVIAYGFEHLGLICIQANVFGGNTKSMRVLEKAGFVKQGIALQSAIKNGRVVDDHRFALYPSQKK